MAGGIHLLFMRMNILKSYAGFTIVELLLFLGIAAIMGGTLVSVYIATQETRVRQQGIANVEQRGAQIVETVAKNIRRAEVILSPASGQTGSILALQMGLNNEFPTIVAPNGSGNILLIQKTGTATLLTKAVTMDAFTVTNIGGDAAVFSFNLTARIPSVPVSTYTKAFHGSASLLPDDVDDAGGCGSCAVPSCINSRYRWEHCINGACTASTTTFACQ